jgi:hypothetical protein
VGPTPSLDVTNFFREDYEERALAQVAHKPVCWFRCVHDTFVIWLHGTEKLERFLDHLNGLRSNIKFTMEMKRDGHPRFLDIDMYGRPDGALGYKVYRKPTQPKIHPHSPPPKPWITPPSLQHTSRSFKLGAASMMRFMENAYSIRQIRWALNSAVRASKPKDNPTSVALLPNVQKTYGRLSRMLAKHNIIHV